MNNIKFYIVGGYVRDKIMGIKSRDRDFCVVGATPEEMLNNGFKKVGADFPVFLNEDGEEYALARKEIKNGNGYHGFEVDYGNDITIEQDLSRRDLTINAIALGTDGEYIDPFGGINDINNKVLKHVSESFSEDPLRILRVARFAAKFKDFNVEHQTMNLMKEMVKNGEVNHLTPERVSVETIKALKENKPSKYFEILLETGALDVIMPEIAILNGIPQPAEHHPEIDTFRHTMMTLDEMCKISDDPVDRFSILVHDLGKGVTPKDILPSHHNHEKKGVPIVEILCKRLKFPNIYKKSGMIAAEHHTHIHKIMDMNHRTTNKFFKELKLDKEDNWKFFERLIKVSESDARGRKGKENIKYPQSSYVEKIASEWREIKMKNIMEENNINNISPENLNKLKMYMEQKRTKLIKNMKKDMKKNKENKISFN